MHLVVIKCTLTEREKERGKVDRLPKDRFGRKIRNPSGRKEVERVAGSHVSRQS